MIYKTGETLTCSGRRFYLFAPRLAHTIRTYVNEINAYIWKKSGIGTHNVYQRGVPICRHTEKLTIGPVCDKNIKTICTLLYYIGLHFMSVAIFNPTAPLWPRPKDAKGFQTVRILFSCITIPIVMRVWVWGGGLEFTIH